MDYCPATRIKDIRRKMLDYRPHIVHFCGHGAGQDGIVFEDDNGDAVCISADVLANFFALFKDTLECVVLNACYSEIQVKEISKYITFVIGMNESIGDNIAIEFAIAFYDAIYANNTYEFAYKLACNAINWYDAPKSLIPVFVNLHSNDQKREKPNNKQTSERSEKQIYEFDMNDKLDGIDKADTLCKVAKEDIRKKNYEDALQSLFNAWDIYICETGIESRDTNQTYEEMRRIYLLLKKEKPFEQWVKSSKRSK